MRRSEDPIARPSPFWPLIFLLTMLVGLAILAFFLFPPGQKAYRAPDALPVVLHSQRQADYQVGQRSVLAPVGLSVLRQVAPPDEPAGVTNARLAALQSLLLTPVPQFGAAEAAPQP